MLNVFLGIMLFQFGGLILPGPDFAIVFRHSIVKGTKNGLLCALGVSIGVMINVLITFLIGTTLYTKYRLLYIIFISIGVLFLYYISISLMRNFFILKNQSDAIEAIPAIKKFSGNSFTAGLLTNLSNAKAIVFFSTILPLAYKLNTIFILFTWFSMTIMSFAWFALVVLLFGNNKIRQAFLAKMHISELLIGIAIFSFASVIFYTCVLSYFLK